MARPVQNAAVCRVNSRVDVLPFEPPGAQLLQRKRGNRSQWTSQVNIQWPNLYQRRVIRLDTIRQTDNSSKYKFENEF